MIKLARMVKRVISGLVLVAVIWLGYLGYKTWRQRRDMLSGEVLGGPQEPSESSGSGRQVPLQVARPSASETPAKASATSQSAAVVSTGVPALDSMTPNPPNGMAYAGSGHFQVYRQGNLTYRINTDTGQSCVLYATNEEWHKRQVYSHGCGSGDSH